MKTQCPQCGSEYDVDDSFIGQKVECECGCKWQIQQSLKSPPRKQVKRKIEPGCVFGIFILLAVLFWAGYSGYSKYVYRDTPENRSFEYKIMNEEKSTGTLYYKATVEIKLKGRLLPNPQDLYYLVKKIAGIRQSYYVYFKLPEYSQRQYFASTESAELGNFYVTCSANVDSKDLDLIKISYGSDYYSKRFPDKSNIIAESAHKSTTTTGSFSARNDAWVYTQFLVERHLKSPKSARFEYGGVERVKETGPGIFIVRSYVDAKNSFGTDIRQYFFCKLQRKSDGKFEVIQLTFE